MRGKKTMDMSLSKGGVIISQINNVQEGRNVRGDHVDNPHLNSIAMVGVWTCVDEIWIEGNNKGTYGNSDEWPNETAPMQKFHKILVISNKEKKRC